MTAHWAGCLIGCALLLGACSPEPKQETTHPSPPSTAAPAAEATPRALSMLLPRDSRCEWHELDLAERKTRVIASFEGSCIGATVAISPDQTKALMLIDPEWRPGGYHTPDMTPSFVKKAPPDKGPMRLYEVAIRTGAVTTLSLRARGNPSEIGYSPQNAALILTVEDVDDDAERKSELVFEGERLPVPDGEGIPVLAHAFQLVDANWKRVETKASLVGADYSPGIHELRLDASRSLNSREILSPHPEGDTITDPALLERLKSHAPRLAAHQDDGQWLRLKSTAVLVWQVNFEFSYATGALRFVDGTSLIEPPGLDFTDGDVVAPMMRGRYLLVTQAATGAYPRLYDLEKRTLLYSTDTAVVTTFWPG